MDKLTIYGVKSNRPLNNDLRDEQKNVLKIISSNDVSYQMLLRNPTERVNRIVKNYYLRKPVIDDLNKNGVRVRDVEFAHPHYSGKKTFQKAMPILVKWLKNKDLNYHVKSSIAHVLVENSIAKQYAFDTIIDEYKMVDRTYKDEWDYITDYTVFLGNAFIKWTDDSYAPIIFNLLDEKRFENDAWLLYSLKNLKKPENIARAKSILLDRLKRHPQDYKLLLTIIETLRKLKAVESKETLQQLLSLPEMEVRREVKKTLIEFDKLSAKKI